MPEQRLRLTLPDHTQLPLIRCGNGRGPVWVLLPDLHQAPTRWQQPQGLASALAATGADVFMLAWRGSDGAWPPVVRNSEHGEAMIAGMELPALGARIAQLRPDTRAYWLGCGRALGPLWRFTADNPDSVAGIVALNPALPPPLAGWRRTPAAVALAVYGSLPLRRWRLAGCDLNRTLARSLMRDGALPELAMWQGHWPRSLYLQTDDRTDSRRQLQAFLTRLPHHDAQIHWRVEDTVEMAARMARWARQTALAEARAAL